MKRARSRPRRPILQSPASIRPRESPGPQAQGPSRTEARPMAKLYDPGGRAAGDRRGGRGERETRRGFPREEASADGVAITPSPSWTSRGHDVERRASDAGGVLGQAPEYVRVSAGTRYPILTPPAPRSLSFPASEHTRAQQLPATPRCLYDNLYAAYTTSTQTKANPFPCTPTR